MSAPGRNLRRRPGPSALPRPWFPKHYADVVQRLRVPAGFAVIAALGWLSKPTPASLLAGLPVALAGMVVRAWAAGHLAKNEALATTGPYALVRNPLYAGSLLAALGLAIASLEPWVGIIAAAVFLLVYFPVMEQEQQHLLHLFPDYAGYAAAVPPLIPRWPPHGPLQGFRWALFRQNREYKAVLAFLLAFAYLAWRAGAATGLGRWTPSY